ncbi:FAD-dependent oxidoreductase [Streptomyces sp. NPDC097610]|uniref:NAD(P)/FAD-dependent oxidoreductase n=1 Tax=Streptomyces sp. NPDC097610 TaxID=3157227 RepID=UPI00331A33F3
MTAHRLVVVGASLAGLRAAEAARRGGYQGQIVLIGDEPHLPYDRPPLSKQMLEPGPGAPHDPTFRSREHLTDQLGIQLELSTRATALDVVERTVHCGDREVPYDTLILATGSTARRLDGTQHLDGIHTLRSLDDCHKFRRDLATAKRVVVVGAGFIGAECASAARARGMETTIVEAAPVPLVRAYGEHMGRVCAQLHERNGVSLRLGAQVQGFDGSDRVEAVRLSDGTRLEADLVVVGVGADPAVEWLRSADLEVESGVNCDSFLATSAPDVYAAGDVARWHNPVFDQSMRLETWSSASEQAAVAARNALKLDKPKEYGTVPYTWTDWYGSRLQFVGAPTAEDIKIVLGDEQSERFVALYRQGDRLVGALAMNNSSVVMKYRAMIGAGASWQDGLDFAAERAARLSRV